VGRQGLQTQMEELLAAVARVCERPARLRAQTRTTRAEQAGQRGGRCRYDAAGGRARQGATPPTKTAALMAMQRCPAAPNAAPVSAATVASRCASGRTTAWFLAPMLACVGANLG